MSLEREVSEIQGKLSVLEKLIMGSLLEQLLDAKLRAINAEAVSVRAVETVQALISDLQSSGVPAESEAKPGVIDIRGRTGRGQSFGGGGGDDDE